MERTPLANALRAIRKRHGLSQEELARLVDRTPGSIGALETNRLQLSDDLFDLIVTRADLTGDEAAALDAARSGVEVELGVPVDPAEGPSLAERVAELEARLAALEDRFPFADTYPMAASGDPTRKGTGKRKRRPSPPAPS